MNLSGLSPRLILMILISATLAGSPVRAEVVPDFGLNVSPSEQELPAGATAMLNITVTSIDGFEGTVTVDEYSPIIFFVGGLPHNFTLTAAGSSSYNVTVPTRLDDVGTFYIDFTGTSGQLSHTYRITLTTLGEPDFTVSTGLVQPGGCSPFGCMVNITAGASKQVTIAVKSYYNFTGPIALSASKFAGREQLGFSFDPEVVSLTANSTATSTLTISVSSTASYGGNWVYVNGTSGGKVRWDVIVVAIPMEFSLAPTISPLTINAGSSGSASVTLTTNGFTRTLNITTSAPSGLTASLSQDRTTVNATARTFTFTLTVSIASGVSAGTYYLDMTGTTVIFVRPIFGGGSGYEKPETSRSTTIPVIVTQASPGPSPSPQPAPVNRILGLEPVMFYGLFGSLVALVAIAVAFIARKQKPPSQPLDTSPEKSPL